jgi:hypothetical protein
MLGGHEPSNIFLQKSCFHQPVKVSQFTKPKHFFGFFLAFGME